MHRPILERGNNQPETKTIFVLGNSAKQALGRFSEFKLLNGYRISDDYDENLAGFRVILCTYPGAQNGAHVAQIEQSFAKIKS
jgi:hypothetical protein